MILETISGMVSDCVSYSPDSGTVIEGHGSDSDSHYVSFTIEGRIVFFRGTPMIGNGDEVTVAGKPKTLGGAPGTALNALALRNDTSGRVYKANALPEVFWLLAAGLLPACLLALLYAKGVPYTGDILAADGVILAGYLLNYMVRAFRCNRRIRRFAPRASFAAG